MTSRGLPETGSSIGDVARLLGVPVPTLRSWEQRYGIPDVSRRAGTTRRYSPTDVYALLLMRDEIVRGTRAGLAADAVRAMLGSSGPAAQHVSALLAASDLMDAAGVAEVLDDSSRALGLGLCLDDVLFPAMRQMGLWWQTGRCDVEQEHVTTAAAGAWLDRLSSVPPSPEQRFVLLSCGPTDLHTLGLQALAALLGQQLDLPCRLAGAKVPTTDLVAAVREHRPLGVVVAAHLYSGRRRAIESIRAVAGLGTDVFYAGNAFSSDRSRRGVPGSYLGTRLQQAAQLIQSSVERVAVGVFTNADDGSCPRE